MRASAWQKFVAETREMIAPERVKTRPGGMVVVRESVLYYLKYMVIAFAIIVFMLVASKLLGLDIKNVNSIKGDTSKAVLYTIVLTALIGPLIEESLFRLWFSFRREHIFITLFIFAYIVLTKCLRHAHDASTGSIQSDYFEYPIAKMLVSSLIASSIFLFKPERIQAFANKYGGRLVFFSVVLFALLHLTNVRCAWYLYPFLVCMCLPQFLLGVSVTHIRLHVGFWPACAFHCIVNAITLLPLLGGML